MSFKDPKTHRRLKGMLFNETKPDRMRIFKEILFFKATNNTKTNHSAVASWILAEVFFVLFFVFMFKIEHEFMRECRKFLFIYSFRYILFFVLCFCGSVCMCFPVSVLEE